MYPHSHRIGGNTQSKLVEELVHKYKKVSYPTPAMKYILSSSNGFSVLVSSLRRQVSLVKCRSQDLEDFQITIYDKALLLLSKYGDDVANPGALEFYLTEFLGIVPIGFFADTATRSGVVTEETSSHHEEPQEDVAQAPISDSGKQDGNFHVRKSYKHKAKDIKLDEEIEQDEIQVHERVERMLDVYRQAKEDYFSTKKRDGVDSLSAVRFLRDSAENALRYLHSNGLSEHEWIPDLERVFAIARDRTTKLLGGRKRHFDEDIGRYNHKRGRRAVDSYRPRKGCR